MILYRRFGENSLSVVIMVEEEVQKMQSQKWSDCTPQKIFIKYLLLWYCWKIWTIEYSVVDTKGMDEEKNLRIFTPFQ